MLIQLFYCNCNLWQTEFLSIHNAGYDYAANSQFSVHGVSYQTFTLALRQQTAMILNVIYHKITATSECDFKRNKIGSVSFLQTMTRSF